MMTYKIRESQAPECIEFTPLYSVGGNTCCESLGVVGLRAPSTGAKTGSNAFFTVPCSPLLL